MQTAVNLKALKQEIGSLADKKQAKILAKFFKTGPGEYGEGDIFLGVNVPVQRKLAVKFCYLPLVDIEKLMHSKFHEYRLTALIILVDQFKKADEKTRGKIYKLYLKNMERINNWDLVDLSAHHIVGAYLTDKPREILYKLAKSESLWKRRIAIIATFAFIREGGFADAVRLAEFLLGDKRDLMHKAVGWVLREVGKKSDSGNKELLDFLDKHVLVMPRTMLRYAIERLPEEQKKHYLNFGKGKKK